MFVITTSSVVVQAPSIIVQRNVALDPTANPVTVVVAEEGVVIVSVPDTNLHTPDPDVGILPAKVNDPLLH